MISGLIKSPPFFATQPDAGWWANPLDGLIVSLATIIMAIGVAIVIWGAYCSVLRLIALETATARSRLASTDTAPVRLLFAAYLLSGLDFLIAGGVIKTLAVSDWRQAAVLGGIVLVRLLLGVGVKWEAGSPSVPMSPPLPESPTAARNGVAPGKQMPEPAMPDARNLIDDPAPVAAHVAR
jgi:uncharacterized membrane protein